MNGKLMLYVDQYGNRFFAESLKQLRRQIPGRCQKVFVDKKDGSVCHVGYYIGGHWLTAFVPYEKPISRARS